MNAPAFPPPELAIPVEFQTCFAAQRAAFLKAPDPAHAERIAELKALARLVKENRDTMPSKIYRSDLLEQRLGFVQA